MEKAWTILMGFFDYNNKFADGHNYLYQEFPGQYVWKRREKEWSSCKCGIGMMIGRMMHCNPTTEERFYLHLLLTSVKDPKSFENLHTIDGVCHPSFQAAYLALGLLNDDQEWVTCFTESITYATRSQLHWLFVTALIFGGISDSLTLCVRLMGSQ